MFSTSGSRPGRLCDACCAVLCCAVLWWLCFCQAGENCSVAGLGTGTQCPFTVCANSKVKVSQSCLFTLFETSIDVCEIYDLSQLVSYAVSLYISLGVCGRVGLCGVRYGQ